MVTGDPVNVAARLQAAAGTGQVLVGETTALAVAAAVELADAQALELKGKSEPVHARRALAVRPERVPRRGDGRACARRCSAGSDELAFLPVSWNAQTRTPARALVVAPPGVGKTRLVDELAARAPGARSCAAAAGRALAVRSRRAAARERRRLGGGSDRYALHASPARARVVVEEALAVLAARRRGLCRRSREPLRRVGRGARRARRTRLDRRGRALGRCRPARVPRLRRQGRRAGGWSSRRRARRFSRRRRTWCAGAARLDLQHAACARRASELVRALVGDALPAELVVRIAERSDGNPLFIEELLRTWISVGTLVPDDGRLGARAGGRRRRPAADRAGDLRGSARRSAAAGTRRRAARVGCGAAFRARGARAAPGRRRGRGRRRCSRGGRSSPARPTTPPSARATRTGTRCSATPATRASRGRSARVSTHGWRRGSRVRPARVRRASRSRSRATTRARSRACPRLRATSTASRATNAVCEPRAWFERAAGAARDLAAHEGARELLDRALELTERRGRSDRVGA